MTRRETTAGRGDDLVRRLEAGVREAEGALRPGARELPTLCGVTTNCVFVQPQENVLVAQAEIWCSSERLFRYGDNLVFATGEGSQGRLTTIATERRVEPEAVAAISNLYLCKTSANDSNGEIQFPPPKQLIELGVSHEPTQSQLPEIKLYARRPVFDMDFNFRGPGWHPGPGYLIHSIAVDPVIPAYIPSTGTNLDRLPPHLRRTLQDFCFKSDADVANTISTLLTGMLIERFTAPGKPIIVMDGNQPEVGKTLLVRTKSEILDGKDADVIQYTSCDEELTKRVVARLRHQQSTFLLIDNAKLKTGGEINSPLIEANSTAPTLALRILGTSTEHRQPNNLLWFITMNCTKACQDVISRSVPIRLYHEGDPRTRCFRGGDPRLYAARHRPQILAELAGMVIHWNQQGRPSGQQRHRLAEWAAIIGGILASNGITGFLSNIEEASAEFNSELDGLTALAEAAVRTHSAAVQVMGECSTTESAQATEGLAAGELAPLFRQTQVLSDRLSAVSSQRAVSTLIGHFLAPHINQTVSIEANHRTGQATLRRIDGRSHSKRYFFEVRWINRDDENPPNNDPPGHPATTDRSTIASLAAASDSASSATSTGSVPGDSPGNDIEW